MSNSTVKRKNDFSALISEKFPIAEALVLSGKLDEALEILHVLEKETRISDDAFSNSKVIVKIAQLCFESKNWDRLCSELVLLSKRKALLKQAFVSLIDEACKYVDETPTLEVKLKLIEALRSASAGKMQVEIQRARLTRKLAEIKESQGDINTAADLLQELNIDNTGSMEVKEKIDFTLEQMRLCLLRKDYIRTQIISKRINPKFFADNPCEDLELRYYALMIELDLNEKEYFSVCKHYYHIFDVYQRKGMESEYLNALKCTVIYLVMSSYSSEQSAMMHRIFELQQLNKLPTYKSLLGLLKSSEVICWSSFCSSHEHILKYGSCKEQSTNAFVGVDGEQHWKDLQRKIIEHNIRIISLYYTQIYTTRLAELLQLKPAESEKILCELVVKKMISAKINRIRGIVAFVSDRTPEETLTNLSHNWLKIMSLVDKTCHLINKEEMVYAAIN